MALPQDWKEFIALLNSRRVEYVVVGAIAVSYHARPRNTGDLDVLIRRDPDNAARLAGALKDFGFTSLGLTADFLDPGVFVQLGQVPIRIDILNQASGVEFDEIWTNRVIAQIDGLAVPLMGREALVKNKRATNREKDRLDLKLLGEA